MSAVLKTFLTNEAPLRRVLARYFRSPQDIEDLLQEVFLRAFAAERQRPILMPRAYLFQTAKNVALNELARRRSNPSLSLEDFPDPSVISIDPQPGPERENEGRRRLAHFLRAAAELPDQCRRVFLLKKVDGLSQSEIAERLGIAESTVEKHLAKGLLMVREYLARLDAPEDGGDLGQIVQGPFRRAGDTE